jgi:hypothetical protein
MVPRLAWSVITFGAVLLGLPREGSRRQSPGATRAPGHNRQKATMRHEEDRRAVVEATRTRPARPRRAGTVTGTRGLVVRGLRHSTPPLAALSHALSHEGVVYASRRGRIGVRHGLRSIPIAEEAERHRVDAVRGVRQTRGRHLSVGGEAHAVVLRGNAADAAGRGEHGLLDLKVLVEPSAPP